MVHCGYPGHATKLECSPERTKVLMPTGKTYTVCNEALYYAKSRGGEVVG